MYRVYYMICGKQDFWCGDECGDTWSTNPKDAAHYTELEAARAAKQLACEYEEVSVTPVKRSNLVTVFILIQDNKVIDRCITPNFLRSEKLDAYAGFKIAIGRVSDTGGREIVGVVADVGPLSGAKTWRISSDMDGMYRLIGAAECPAMLVTNRLGVMQGAGKFCNLADLPMRVVITAFGPTTPMSTEDVVEAIVPG